MPNVEIPIGRSGLLVDVEIGASAALRALLWRQGKEPPLPVHCTLLVDTGADTTMVNGQTLRTLGLAPTSETRIVTATSGPGGEPCAVYAVDLMLVPSHPQRRSFASVEVVEKPLLNQSVDGLLGRDLLRVLVLQYDGPRGRAHLSW